MWITQTQAVAFPSPSAPGETFSLPYKPSVAGTHVIEFWAIDQDGNRSNVVTDELVATSVPGPQNSVPLASALSFAPTSAFNGQATLVTGTLDVADVDENLATLHLRFKKPSGQRLAEQSFPLTLAAPSGGQVSFAIAITPDMVGNWTLEAYVKDASGAKSTTLTGGLAVTAPPSTVPVSSGVSFTPTTATAGEPTAFSGSVAFDDADGDLASVHVRFKRPGNSLSSETIIPYAGGEGEAPFSVTFTGTVGGTYTLEAWVKDQKGQKSNTVTGTIEFAAPPVADNTPRR